MKFQRIMLWGGILLSFSSCSKDYLEPSPVVSNSEGLKISMGGPLTRSANVDAVLSEMRVYCFDRSTLGGNEPAVGSSSSYAPAGVANPMTPFHHIVQGLTKSGMTLLSNQMRTGKWDVAMIAHRGAALSAPIAARRADQLLMYTFDPASNGGQAHEFYHNYCRLPEITTNNQPYVNTSVSRNVAKVRVVIERAVDVNAAAISGSHTITLDGIPRYISWAGTLLANNSGTLSSDKGNFDVFPNGTPAFVKNVSFTVAAEAGAYKSDTVDYIIPAYRGIDFWQINSTTNTLEMNPTPTDTITKKMTLSVSFSKSSGGVFAKSVTVPRVAQCNRVLLLKVRMSDTNIEIKPEIKDWSATDVEGNVGAAYLNVSKTTAEIYDGSVSRLYFWSNQPVDSVYIANQGKTIADIPIADVNTIFDRLAGPRAVNLHYDQTTKEGYVDICQTNTSATLADNISKVYLNAGGLKREIIVKRKVTNQAAKNIITPYVGTFHRSSQMGERVVTWSYNGDWNAVVEGATKNEVLIDRLPSPNFSGEMLYGTNFGDAEQAAVSDWGGKVVGKGRIYFRVGWKSRHAATEASPARYATVVVRQGSSPGMGSLIQTLYLRQGEGADYLMSPGDDNSGGGTVADNRSFAKRFSPYNLTSTDRNPAAGGTQVTIHGGAFVLFPSQAGAFFQWANDNKARYAYNPVLPVPGWQNNYPPTYWTVLGATDEACPSGYRRPNDGTTSAANTTVAVAGSEIRQSLWEDPQPSTSIRVNNSAWGYYADGFFDRGEIASSTTSNPNSAVSQLGAEVAYVGRLFFNPNTKASLFFPATGDRGNTNGALGNAGAAGKYWTSSASDPNNALGLRIADGDAHQATYIRSYGFPVRCIACEKVTLTFNPNGATGVAPTSITEKELSNISVPGKGGLTKGTEYFSGWNSAADGSGKHYPAGSNMSMPIGGGTLYAIWLYMEESEEIVIPNSDPFTNVKEVTIAVTGGVDQTFRVVNDGPKWFNYTIVGNKLRITAAQSINQEPRESTITLAHNSDPNYTVTFNVSQHFFTSIPPFDYFSIKFTWTPGGDMDVAVEFNDNKMANSGTAPKFDKVPVGYRFIQILSENSNASYVKTNGARAVGGKNPGELASAMANDGLLFWAGDGQSAVSGESVFFNAKLIETNNSLERYVKLDVYNVWFMSPPQAAANKSIQMGIAAFQGGTMSYDNYVYNCIGGSTVYSMSKDNPIKRNTPTMIPIIRLFEDL